MSQQQPDWIDPGVERHAWESEYESLLGELADDPEGTLPELADLVGRMLEGLGFPTELGGSLDTSEHARAFAAANELARRARDGEDLDPGDVGFAVGELQAVYESLIEDGRSA